MVIGKITNVLEKRRAELVNILENSPDSVELEKQHQIYGAINEIDLFLHTLEYYENETYTEDVGPINLVRPPEQKASLFTKMFDGIIKKIKRNK